MARGPHTARIAFSSDYALRVTTYLVERGPSRPAGAWACAELGPKHAKAGEITVERTGVGRQKSEDGLLITDTEVSKRPVL